METAQRSRPPWTLVLVVAAGAAVLTARQVRRRHAARDDDRPADLGFMRAIHAGLRRDAVREAAIQAVDAALTSGAGVTTAARRLGDRSRSCDAKEREKTQPPTTGRPRVMTIPIWAKAVSPTSPAGPPWRE